MALLGYSRVSTLDQTLDPQRIELLNAGCDHIFEDRISGTVDDRPGLQALMRQARPGDQVICVRLDRMARSLASLLAIVHQLESRGVDFKSLRESLDTKSPGGKLIFHVCGAIAEFERSLIVERTKAGLAAARARGRFGGRPPALSEEALIIAKELHGRPDLSISQICRTLNVSRATLYRSLKKGRE